MVLYCVRETLVLRILISLLENNNINIIRGDKRTERTKFLITQACLKTLQALKYV